LPRWQGTFHGSWGGVNPGMRNPWLMIFDIKSKMLGEDLKMIIPYNSGIEW
jgi:hypothetical protein